MIYGVKENRSFDNVFFTYVVDSDESLTSWAENKAGNDYTAVLIKAGNWTCEKSLDLTNAGTKIVVGEAGSKLIFNLDSAPKTSAIAYSILPDIAEHFLLNVNVFCNRAGNAVAFSQCVNLYNCSAEVNGGRASGFYKCENLLNCVAKCNATETEYSVPFYYSNGLNNCTAYATAEEGTAYGYSKCERLNGCRVESLESNVKVCGFNNCNYCFACLLLIDKEYPTINGFFGSKKLFGCVAIAKGTSEGNAFYGCANLDCCDGTGNYGFYNCTAIHNCTATATVAKAYNTCANAGDYNATYAYANTPEGGFNN